ncbi:MAG: GHKL domain-containing protein [Gammaproteobacteria bacterium]|nr:GHKL domain-containing protein [Gammaproteobacteria bacterium]
MKTYSLRRRLLISATLLLVVFLGVMGVGLNNAFQQSVLSNAEDALRNQILLLMANVDVVDAEVVMPAVLSEPRLSQTDSSLYAQINRPPAQVAWRSDSLLERQLPALSAAAGEFQFFDSVQWPGQPAVYAMTLGVVWETGEGDVPLVVQVAENTEAYVQRMAQYQHKVVLWLAILGVSLISLLLALLSWAVNPLVRVTRQVSEIERGQRHRFDEDYPEEVSRLTQNLNQLLNFEEQRINRQKEVLGNLAHSLKTPVAVLRGLDYADTTRAEAEHQLGAMQNIIDYQLQSASAVGRRRFAKPIDVRPPTEQIIASLQKLYDRRQLGIHLNIDEGVEFFGDQGDWMELVGNLLDNACKWATGEVTITVCNKPLNSHRSATQITVSDDGDGIDPQLKNTILQRGVRLDSQTPGHGLGLHIVKGIVEAYGGDLRIDDVQPQGTRFEVVLN